MLPKALYEVLPYFCIFSALGLMTTQSDWLVLAFSWLLYTAGSIQWVLRSDARRRNKRVPEREKALFLHEDIYESLPFMLIGFGVLIIRFVDTRFWFFVGFAFMAWGGYILAIRITRRKISWIDDWRRYRGSAIKAKVEQRKRNTNPICDQCVVREHCRRSGLTDRSNILVMGWLQNHTSLDQFGPLKEMVDRAEFLPVSSEAVLKVIIRHQPYAKQCLVIRNRKKMAEGADEGTGKDE